MGLPVEIMFGHPLRGARPDLDDMSKSVQPAVLAEQNERFEQAMIESGHSTFSGETQLPPGSTFASPDGGFQAPVLLKAESRRADIARMTKGLDPATAALVKEQLAKEWTLGDGLTTGNPIGTGLVPFDLEAPAKLLTPRPTPRRGRRTAMCG
jgi:hypothetical protein